MSQAWAPQGEGGGASAMDGEFPFTRHDFQAIAAMLHEDTGIALPESKATLAYSRLAKRLRSLGLHTFGEYCALVSSAAGAGERAHMLSSLTTNVTRFFREPHHFKHLETHALPPLLERARRGGRVRLWSAACSSGQEPYSLALTLLSLAPDVASLDVRILATDIDPVILTKARQGCYNEAELAPVPSSLRRWFSPAGPGSWTVGAELRRLVSVRTLNLTGTSWPMHHPFDAVMCRNVVIYFDEATQVALWERFAGRIAPGGYLYIGHSERLSGPAVQVFETAGLTTYVRRQGVAR